MPAAVPMTIAAIVAANTPNAVVAGIITAVGVGMSAALSYAEASRLKKNAKRAAEADAGIKANTTSTTDERRVIYGRRVVGGTRVYMESTGNNNRDLWMVLSLGWGEWDAIEEVYLDSKPISEFGDKASYTFHPGTADQTADAALAAALPQHTDAYRHTAYLAIKLRYDTDKFLSMPTVTVKARCLKVYDPRTGQDVWSRNPALCLYDWLTNEAYGRGWDAEAINVDSVISAANYCDARGWVVDYLGSGKSAQAVQDDLLRHFRGHLVWRDGQFHFRYRDIAYEAVCMTIDERHILTGADGKASLELAEPKQWGTPEGLRVSYVDPDKDWSVDTIPIGEANGYVEDMELTGFSSRSLAAHMGTYLLERMQLNRTLSGTFRGDCVKLEPGDLVEFNYPPWGISGQLLRVVSTADNGEQQISLGFEFEEEKLYDAELNIALDEVYTCNLPDPTAAPPSVVSAAATELLDAYRQRSVTKLRIEFALPDDYPWFDHVEVWRSLDGGETYTHQFSATSDFEIDNIVEGQTVRLRLRTVNIRGVRQSEAAAYVFEHVVQGLTGNPPSLAALFATIGSDSVTLWANPVIWPDLSGYTFRMGPTWTEGVRLGDLSAPNYAIPSCKPGGHVFWGNSVANNGKQGVIPRSTSVTLPDPPVGWTISSIHDLDYAAGAFDNAEAVLFNGEYHLRCKQADGNLVGKWTGPMLDLSSVGQRICYALTDGLMIGSATTWDGAFGETVTWADIGENRPWTQIFESSASPSVRMWVEYGDTTALGKVMERMEILSAVLSGRYFRLVIEITDPQVGSYTYIEPATLKFGTR